MTVGITYPRTAKPAFVDFGRVVQLSTSALVIAVVLIAAHSVQTTKSPSGHLQARLDLPLSTLQQPTTAL